MTVRTRRDHRQGRPQVAGRRALRRAARREADKSNKRLRRALVAAAGAAAAPLAAAAPADAADYWWYLPYGDYNLINKTTYPNTPDYHWSLVGPNYLNNHMIGQGMIGGQGGINGMLQATDYGDYCAAAQTGPMTTPADEAYGWYVTGFTPRDPWRDYQRRNGQPAGSACQADRRTWGQYLGNDGQTNCTQGGEACGIFHYVSMANGNDYPWGNSFGSAAELHVKSTYHVNTFQDPTPQTQWALAASCAVLKDMTTSRYLELCLNKWQGPDMIDSPVQDNAADCAGNIGTVWFTLPTQTGNDYATQVGSQGTQGNGALGTRTVEFRINKGQLKNLAARSNQHCGWSPANSIDAAQYRLIGIEDGMEIGQTGITHWGMHQQLLAAWTQY